MATFEFSLVASGLDPEAEDFEQRFYDAGCDDAGVGFQRGRIILDVSREASGIEDAVVSAIAEARVAGAEIVRVEPDPFVNLADIAGRTGLTRAAVTQYARGQRGGADFPAPVAKVTSGSPLWDWVEVALWLYESRRLDGGELVKAVVLKRANELLASSADEFERLLKVEAATARRSFPGAELRKVG